MDEWFPGCVGLGERRSGCGCLMGYRVSFWGDEMFWDRVVVVTQHVVTKRCSVVHQETVEWCILCYVVL